MSEDLLELTDEEEERAERLHEDSIFIDGLIPRLDYLSDPDYRDHLGDGGVTAASFTVAHWPHEFRDATESIVDVHRWVEEADDRFSIVRTVDDIRDAHENDKTGVILSFQDARPVQREEDYVKAFGLMGVRIIQLTYNTQNYLGAGACERDDGGLTIFGEKVIDELIDNNILIDLSHCADKTTMEAIEYADAPVAFTHVGVREMCNAYGRCKTDEQMKAIVENGGIVGMGACFPPLIKRDPDTHEILQGTVNDVLDQMEYMIDLVGIDNVTIGTDMSRKGHDIGKTHPTSSIRNMRPNHPEVFGVGPTEHYDPPPVGLESHREMINITRGLVARGYTDDDIRKVLGENYLDLLEIVWE